MNGNIKIEENIKKKNRENNKNNIKVHFSNGELFEMMKEDDENYNILEDYKEDDGTDSDYDY